MEDSLTLHVIVLLPFHDSTGEEGINPFAKNNANESNDRKAYDKIMDLVVTAPCTTFSTCPMLCFVPTNKQGFDG